VRFVPRTLPQGVKVAVTRGESGPFKLLLTAVAAPALLLDWLEYDNALRSFVREPFGDIAGDVV